MTSLRRCLSSIRFALGASPLRACAVVLLAVVAGAMPVLVAWFTKVLVDAVAGDADNGRVVGVIAGLLTAMILTQLIPTVSALIEADLGRAVELKARHESFTKVNSFGGLTYFENPRFHDDLRLAVSAGEQVPVQILSSATAMIQGAVTLVGFVVALVSIDWRAAVLVLLAAVPRLIVEMRLGRERFQLQADLSPVERLQMFYGMLQTNPAAAKEIRLFGLGDFFLDRMLVQLRRAHRATRVVEARTARSQALLDLVALVPLALCLALGARAAVTGQVGPGDVVLFLAALSATESSMASLAVMAARLNELSLTVSRFESFLAIEPDIERGTGRTAPPLETLEIRDLWFRYRADLPWVLRGLNVSVDAGQSVAIVGVNGAGKSTLVKLICRFYDPERGVILWNGCDIREYDVDSVRARIGSVFQDFMSYDLTVRDNIAVGELSKLDDDEALFRAVGQVGLSETVTGLSRGLDTQLSRMYQGPSDEPVDDTVGDIDVPAGMTPLPDHMVPMGAVPADDGTFLSGGQWQRLAIARMMLRADSDLLILDEPTSGLDPEAEYDLNALVQNATEGRARILISHRLNSVRMASRIVVMDGGTVVEDGAHADLMNRDGRYSTLFGLQRSGYVD